MCKCVVEEAFCALLDSSAHQYEMNFTSMNVVDCWDLNPYVEAYFG